MIRIVPLLTLFFLLTFSLTTVGAEIIGPDVRLTNNDIVVTTGLALDEKSLVDLKNGISKEITFYVDLFRFWNVWPNEFITGKKIIKTLRCDPIKKEYIATSFDGTTLIEKRFKSFESMLGWSLTVRDIRIINEKELEKADYFIKITAESRLRKLPPVINYLFFFVEEKEFRVTKDSGSMTLGTER